MRRIGARHGRTAGEVAIAWTLRNPALTAAIVGMRSREQVEGVIGALEFRLSPEEIAEIVARWTSGDAVGVELVDPSPEAKKAVHRYVAELLERGAPP